MKKNSKMKNESVKNSLEKSKNVLEEKRKMVKQNVCIKKINTFTIIATSFVRELLIKMFGALVISLANKSNRYHFVDNLGTLAKKSICLHSLVAKDQFFQKNS